jgi:hypothetical protein
VSKVIADIATKIVEKAPLWIKFPRTEEEFEGAKADWQVSGLWTVHIFQSGNPRSMEIDEYTDKKVFPSINVQATCNSQELFISVDVS